MKSLAVVPSSGIDMSPFMPPQQLCPITTIFSTFKCKTAYSMAAPAPEYLVLSNGGTMLAMLRTTKASPGWKSKMWEGHTLESEQANTINFGLWPLASSPYSSGFFKNFSVLKLTNPDRILSSGLNGFEPLASNSAVSSLIFTAAISPSSAFSLRSLVRVAMESSNVSPAMSCF
uniref:Uncharacterized protein n=1 Tax=Medicago truncatula TaxID=3880 RepID=I3SJV8_MEDTR|nr:unknown [Medicago truncatula]